MNKTLLICSLSLCLGPLPSRAEEVRSGTQVVFNITEVGPGVFAAISPGPQKPALSNSAFILLSDGVLVVDSHLTQEASKMLLAQIRKVTDKPIRYLVQTHHHGDHVGGNPAFPEAVDIIAHARAREHLLRSNETGAVLPNAAVEEGISFYRGREVNVRYAGRGHTDGDLYVWLPKERILIAGDLVFNGYIGFMRDAYVADWAETLGKLIDLRPLTVIPGHGDITDANAIKIFRTYLYEFITAVRTLKKSGKSGQEAARDFELPSSYASWGMQKAALKDNVLRVYYELD